MELPIQPLHHEQLRSVCQRRDGHGDPAFEIFDAEGDKIFDTNEDSPATLQEANARLATAAPELLTSLMECARLLADYDESPGEDGDIYRRAIALIGQATGRSAS